ncbi:MAG: GntR family transcriptional regulator, partial [Deltaproteobacteria bacterium]
MEKRYSHRSYYEPGQKLVAEELSRQMGVSRIPIREAFGRLASRMLIRKTPQKGAVVTELSESNIREIQQLRLMLEVPAARKAAEHVSEEALNHLKAANQRYIDAWERFDADNLLLANKHFHCTLYKQANMPILMHLIDHVWSLLSPYYHIIFRQTRLE